MKPLIFLLLLLPVCSFAQKTDDLFTLRFGPSSSNIIFKEAYVPDVNLFGFKFPTGHTFSGDGVAAGVSKDLNGHVYLDMGFASFSSSGQIGYYNGHGSTYTLKGFQIPFTVNYLIRKSEKKFRINTGGGLQYLNAHLEQFDVNSSSGATITDQIRDIRVSEVQLIGRLGLQYRIVRNLFVSFMVSLGVSNTGRYSDSPSFFVKYTFRKKK